MLAARAHPAAIAAELRHTREVHDHARSVAARNARFLDRGGASLEDDIGGDAVLVVVDDDPQALERFDHFDPDRSDPGIHAFHIQVARRADVILDFADPNPERGIHDVEVRIDP